MKTKSIIALLAAAFIGGGFTTAFAADDHKGHDKHAGHAGVPKDYPLHKCPVSDEKLGEHGKPVKVTAEGTDVWLCCKSCLKDFNKDPGKYVGMVKAAAKKK